MQQKLTISTKKILSGDASQLKSLMHFLADADELAAVCEPASQALTREQLFSALNQLQHSDLESTQTIITGLEWSSADQKIILTEGDYHWLIFVDRFFFQLLDEAELDQGLSDIVLQLRVPFAKALLLDENLVNEGNHIIRLFFERLIASGRSWYGGLGRAGESYFKQLVVLVELIKNQFETDFSALSTAYEQLNSFVDKENQRVVRLEKRLLDTEAGQIRARRAQHVAVSILNENLAGKLLPKNLIQFLHGPWQDELRLFVIQKGPDQQVLKGIEKLFSTLLFSFQAPTSDEARQKLYSIVPMLGEEFRKHIELISDKPEKYQEIISQIEAAHIQILKGEVLECNEVPYLEAPDMVAGIATTISAQLVKKAEELEEGGWLIYSNEDGDSIRCKLLSKIAETDQLLFVNRNGLKVLQKGLEDMAFCLSTHVAKPISNEPCFMMAYQKTARSVLEEFETNQQAIRDRQSRKAEEERVLEAQRIKQQQALITEERARAAAATKAKLEAEVLALAKSQAEKEAAEQARLDEIEREQQAQVQRENEAIDARKVARLSLHSINIGAWVEVPNSDGVATKCTLAVKINSTGKYIFVDRNGLKVTELLRNDLVELLVEKKARILELGENFEDRLAKVVGSMRQDKS